MNKLALVVLVAVSLAACGGRIAGVDQDGLVTSLGSSGISETSESTASESSYTTTYESYDTASSDSYVGYSSTSYGTTNSESYDSSTSDSYESYDTYDSYDSYGSSVSDSYDSVGSESYDTYDTYSSGSYYGSSSGYECFGSAPFCVGACGNYEESYCDGEGNWACPPTQPCVYPDAGVGFGPLDAGVTTFDASFGGPMR